MNIPMPSNLELGAILFTTVCIFLAMKNNIHTWWTGLVGCALYGALFYESKLYADTLLQVFFFGTGIWGWVNWNKQVEKRPTTYVTGNALALMLGGGLVTSVIYGFLLHTYTDAYAPFIDSMVLAFSVIAQFLLMYRKVQNWPVWVLVNVISVPLYWSKELYLSSFLYSAYLINACYAWYHWVKLAKEEGNGSSSAPLTQGV